VVAVSFAILIGIVVVFAVNIFKSLKAKV
jgi:hypothetical protein